MRIFDIKRIQEAGDRYKQRVTTARAARKGAPTRRYEWLSRNLARDRAKAYVCEAEATGVVASQTNTLRSISRERIIGKSDLIDMNYLELAVALSRAIARIRLQNGFGTGFLVGPGILMTNNHVLESTDEARHAFAQFDYQDNSSGEMLPVQVFRLVPDRFFYTHVELDFTVVAVEPQSTSGNLPETYPWIKMIGTLGKADEGDAVNIIQHPQGGLKQIALRNNEIVRIPEGKKDFLYYTADTEPGSSGSPCFNDQWELVALHHSGVPAMKGGKILKKDKTPWNAKTDDPSLIEWIANEGVRISAIVDSVRNASLTSSEIEFRDQMLEAQPPNPVELARGKKAASKPATQSDAQDAGTFSWIVPLKFTMTVGEQVVPKAMAAAAGAGPGALTSSAGQAAVLPGPRPLLPAAGPLEKVVIDPDWSSREGYDAKFLGLSIPLPKLSKKMQENSVVVPSQFRKNGHKYILHYHHYSVALNRGRRQAWFSAAIIDGDNRFKLPEREDQWFVDPRIDDVKNPVNQAAADVYAGPGTDRGHLTRYLDVAWGQTREEAINSVNDTFHFTNCSVQLAGFNRTLQRWQGLEQFLLENKARKEKRRLIVFTGPEFRANDPEYRVDGMDIPFRVPLRFWKVCAIIRPDGTLSATGFILDQDDITKLKGFEAAKKFDVKAAQVTIADLEKRTGLEFGSLTGHDHFADGGAPGTLELKEATGARRLIKPLETFEEIVV